MNEHSFIDVKKRVMYGQRIQSGTEENFDNGKVF